MDLTNLGPDKRFDLSYFNSTCIQGHDCIANYMIEKVLEVKIDHMYSAA